MKSSPTSITVTLHWQGESGPCAANIICEDSPPAVLTPLLAAGCGLPACDSRGASVDYILRSGAAGGRPLRPGATLSAQGLRDGGHLWLAAPAAARQEGPHHCALALPDGGALLVPLAGLTITRRWLLKALELLHPESYARELRLLDAGRSDYRFVSNRPHCALIPAGPGAWQALTERDDVETLLNGAPLPPYRPARLADGDALQIGAGGPALSIALI